MGAPNKFLSMAKKKCPNCRKGDMYCNKSIFPLKGMMDMPEHCPSCGMKYEIEVGFWFGTGYVSYALSVGLIFAIAIVFALTVGFSWKNNSVYWFLGVMIFLMIVLQPFIMRYARVLYLYFFVGYGRGKALEQEK